MTKPGSPSPAEPTQKPAAKTSAERQAALRLRRLSEGRKQYPFWLTPEEQAKVRNFLAGDIAQEKQARELAEKETFDLRNRMFEMQNRLDILEGADAERDRMKAAIDEMRRTNADIYDQRNLYLDELNEAEETINSLRAQLREAESRLKEHSAKAFKVPELHDRRAVIVKALSMRDSLAGGQTEKSISDLKAQTDLAKKFSTEIKNARTRLLTLVYICTGEKILENPSKGGVYSGWQKFGSPVISEPEKALMLEACAVLHNLEHNVERAGHDVGKLYDQRVAEDQERRRQAKNALDQSLFAGLDRRGEVLFMAAQRRGEVGWGEWADLMGAVSGRKPLEHWQPTASNLFRKALEDEKDQLVGRIADTMRSNSKSADELVAEIVEKFRHPDIEEKYGPTANQVLTFLVTERLKEAK